MKKHLRKISEMFQHSLSDGFISDITANYDFHLCTRTYNLCRPLIIIYFCFDYIENDLITYRIANITNFRYFL